MDHRVLEPEVMDQPDLDPSLHRQALSGLRRLNWWSRTAATLWAPIERLARQQQLRQLSVLDLACGGGDVTVAVADWGRKSGLNVQVEGWDISHTAIAYAQDRLPPEARSTVRFQQRDVFTETPVGKFDVVYSTLFLHHLTEERAVVLMRWMARAARRLVLVDDLYRSRAGYLLAQTACRLLSRSPVVHTDGPLSVRAAYRTNEALDLAARAGWERVAFRRHWPQRFLLAYYPPSSSEESATTCTTRST